MGLKMLFDNASEKGEGVWSVRIPPHQIPMLGNPKANVGSRSVLLVDAPDFDSSQMTIGADVNSILVLNQGTSADTLLIDSNRPLQPSPAPQVATDSPVGNYDFGPGDREFLVLVDAELRGEANEAAHSILKLVRHKFPGDLQRGLRNNFKNTPDNFWYIVVQPQVQALSITVRGSPKKFLPSLLSPKDDRPGYTRFKLTRVSEVTEAFRIIQLSTRK